VLRGGSFNNNERNARCAYRNRNNPNNRNDNNGFRVVVSTFFPPELQRGPDDPVFAAAAKNGRARSRPSLKSKPGK